MKEILRRQNSQTFLVNFLPASLLNSSCDTFQRALVDESGMIRTHIRTHNRPENGPTAYDFCTIPPRNSNQ
jgi:hypothetical protein